MKVSRKIVFIAVALIAIVIGLLVWAPQEPVQTPPRVIVTGTTVSNGLQFVTFGLDPAKMIVTYADIIPANSDTNTSFFTTSFGEILPVRTGVMTNNSLRFVGLPLKGAVGPKYTPGRYTVLYTPGDRPERLRVGVAFEHSGPGDLMKKLSLCWKRKSWRFVLGSTHTDPVFIVFDPSTNKIGSNL